MILRSQRALSPVVASIILIAVTVAVSIAVAAWMGALTFNFPPANIKITPVFLEPHAINITITNNGPYVVHPWNLLVNNATVWPVVVIDKLSIGSSKTSLIDYNWTYNTPYEFTLFWWNANGLTVDISKEFNSSTRIYSQSKVETLVLPIPEFNNSDYAMWTWDYYLNNYPQYRSNMMLLPANMTIDVTMMPNDTMLKIKIFYYNSADSMLFDYAGEKNCIVIAKGIAKGVP